MNIYRTLMQIGAGSLLTMNVSSAAAVIVEIAAITSGWVQHDGNTNIQSGPNANYFAGTTVTNGKVHRNLFVFDLSGIQGNILSATLRLGNPQNGFYSFDNDYYGQSNEYTYYVTRLGDSGTGISASDLLADNWSYPYTGIAAWSDMNSAMSTYYGSTLVGEASNGTIVEIPLTAQAVGELNLVAGSPIDNLFALGGGLNYNGARKLHVFAYTYPDTDLNSRTLSLVIEDQVAVPVPPAALLLGSGIALLRLSTSRRT